MKNIILKLLGASLMLSLMISFSATLVAYATICPDGSGVPDGVACPKTTSISPSAPTTPTTPTTGGSRTILPINNPGSSQSGSQGSSQVISLPNPLGSTKTIPELIGKIVDWLILIASIAVLPFMIIWGAYQFLMAGGNPDKVTEGRHTITWAIVGYALLLLSKGIELIVQDILTR